MSAQFDICRISGLSENSAVDLAIVLQDDMMSDLSTRVVAPLIPLSEGRNASAATPQINVEGVHYIVALHLMATLPKRNLGSPIVNVRSHETALKRALDLLFFGI